MVKIGNIALGEFPLLLAPMEDVSDPPFRALCREQGADLVFTEFISSEGLIRDAEKSIRKLDIYPEERPVGIQLFGGDNSAMERAAEIASEALPDLIDINYGCPVKKVVCKGAGAAILRDIPRMVAMTAAVVRATSLPVTVKTRLGWDDGNKTVEEAAERLQDAGISAITIHGRTRVQMYKGEADWTLIGRVKENPRITIPVFGNGDVDSPQKALEMKRRYGVDGVMIGRASIGNPWIFRQVRRYLQTGEMLPEPGVDEKAAVCRRHLERSVAWKGERLAVFEMRRHYGSYFRGLPGASAWRQTLVMAETSSEVYETLERLAEHYRSDGAEAVLLHSAAAG